MRPQEVRETSPSKGSKKMSQGSIESWETASGPIDSKLQGEMEESRQRERSRIATVTGFGELSPKYFFLILLLWLPRFFPPWITAWHEFNVFILADPSHIERRERDLFCQELVIFFVKCALSILASVVADLANLRFYVYLLFLVLYALCPVAGATVDVLLRWRLYDDAIYSHWYNSIVYMRWAMAINFIFFPVQFACIFLTKDDLSRVAHYSWTGLFAFLEFVNAYIAFWTIPGKCPTGEWTQSIVWFAIGALLYIVITLTVGCTLLDSKLRLTYQTCFALCGLESSQNKVKINKVPQHLKMKKLKWFGLMLIPILFSSFLFATLERFVPDEDWDKHGVNSATSMFLLGRMLGVVGMIATLLTVRNLATKSTSFWKQRVEVWVFGVPHFLNILALLVLVGRFGTLSHLSEGEVIHGPVPDMSKAVVIFFNVVFRNRTVCIGSDQFRPLKVRPFHYGTRELSHLDSDSFTFSVTPEPLAVPSIASYANLNHVNPGGLYLFTISLYNYLNSDAVGMEKNYVDSMSKPRIIREYGVEKLRPTSTPTVIIFNTYIKRKFWASYLLNHGKPSVGPDDAEVTLQANVEGEPVVWNVPKLGNWFIRVYRSEDSDLSSPFKLEVNNSNSLYALGHYLLAPVPTTFSDRGTEYPEYLPVGFKLFHIAEVAGPDSNTLPDKRVLQLDWAIQLGMTLAGMAAGGVFAGIVYLFWMDPPFPNFQTTGLAVFWVLMAGAAESPKVKLVDVGITVSAVLFGIQIACTVIHFIAAIQLYTPELNFRKRPD